MQLILSRLDSCIDSQITHQPWEECGVLLLFKHRLDMNRDNQVDVHLNALHDTNGKG